MSQVLILGAVASGALLAGAVLGSFWTPPDHLWAAALGFVGGAPAFDHRSPRVAFGTVAGFLAVYLLAEL